MAFNGLGLHLGNLSRLSRRRPAPSVPKIRPASAAKARWRFPIPRPARLASSARDGRSRRTSSSMPGETATLADIAGSGAIPANLDDADGAVARQHPANLLGRLRRSRRSNARSAISSPADGTSMRRSRRWRSASIRAARSTATGRCRFAKRCRITMTNHRRDADDPLLPNQLHADRSARGRCLLSCAVPARQSAPVKRGLHHPRRRQRARPLRRHLHGVGRQQLRMVGRR